MKREDYYGKYILHEGDLKPVCIDDSFFKMDNAESVIEHIADVGLLFDNKEDAELACANLTIIGIGIKNHTIIKEPTYYDEDNPRVYISGPISGHNLEERRKAFKEIQEHLEAQGYEPINPMENGLSDEASTHEHMKRDIELLMTCDYIYMMRRWTHSKGCKVEFDVATAIGLPVFFEESGEIIGFE